MSNIDRLKLYKDTLYGITAAAPSTSMAWMLVRNECVSRKVAIPTMDKIEFVRALNQNEATYLLNKNK